MKKDAITSSVSIEFSLKEMGIVTPLDVLEHFPRRYEDLSLTPLKDGSYRDKERIVTRGRVLTKPRSLRFSKASLSRFSFMAESGEVFDVEAWNRPYLSSGLDMASLYTVVGSYDLKRRALSLLSVYKGAIAPEDSLKPVYSLPSDVPNRVYLSIVKRCFRLLKGQIQSFVPEDLRSKYRLPEREEALRDIHFPRDPESLKAAIRLFKYEEALLFELGTVLMKGANRPFGRRSRKKVPREPFWRFVDSLPYPLTDCQRKALEEALGDFDSKRLMYRLLQGDVGSGKTLVASLLCYASYLRGEQAAFMAPTESLARQHYASLTRLFENTPVRVGLMTGSQKGLEKRQAKEGAAEGYYDIVVGTQALIAQKADYRSLGFAVIDEQHKFGVDQRASLAKKGEDTDLLLMSATPIPRSLAMTAFGDLDISILDAFPHGERDVETRLAKSPKELRREIDLSLSRGGRVYIVAPEIEGKEESPNAGVKDLYLAYEASFEGRVRLLHGKMGTEEKLDAMSSFASGKTPILVATSLVEVGLDVPQADLMIVYHPTHFSLSSLHQLRGRIGRNGKRALFLLVPEKGLSDEAARKLEVIIQEKDGFKIAEWDLRLRGPGEISGVRQSGLPSFRFLALSDDYRVFGAARKDAESLLPKLKGEAYRPLLTAYRRYEGRKRKE